MRTCKIIIKDEVNCKITDIDLSERRALSRKFEYEIPGARYLPSVRLGRWSGKVSYFSIGGSTYINLLPEIIPVLESAGYDIELEDMRTYRTSFQFTAVSEDTFSSVLWPEKHQLAGQPILLRDYQVDVVNNFLENPQCIQVAPTGSGKTLITATLSYSVQPYGRSIVIVPNKSLVTQTEADYINLGLNVGVYYGDRKEIGRQHTICTWQSVLQIIKNTQNGEGDVTIGDFLDNVVCVICDEVHGVRGEQLKSMLSGVMSHIPIRWGLTGTIPKEEFASTALTVCIGPVVNKLTAIELQDKGVLSNCHVNILQLQDHREFADYQKELKFLLEDSDRVKYLASLINKISQNGNTLVLVDRISAGESLLNLVADSVFVSGSTKNKDRQTEYESVSDATNKVIIATYQVAAVGINIPRIFNVVLVEPGKSFVRTIQSIGRGLRKAKDKDFVQIWDITSSCKFSKRHLTKRKEFYKEVEYNYTIEKVNWQQ
jgi:superfamily II DNA or RNA helicase